MREASKATARRYRDGKFHSNYFVGDGIDVGAGNDPLRIDIFKGINSLKVWDLEDGDAQLMASVKDNSYDFVHSSHSLEHMVDPYEAIENWIRITKMNGYLIILVPDEDLYEQGKFPSTYNPDHKWTFTIQKENSWSPKSINILHLLEYYSYCLDIEKIQLLNEYYVYQLPERVDQTLHNFAECSIEIILKKKSPVSSKPEERDVYSQVKEGMVALKSGATRMAGVKLNEVYNNNKMHPVALWGMAQYSKIQNNPDAVLKFLTDAFVYNTSDKQVQVELMQFLEQHDPPVAKTVINQLISKNPDTPGSVTQILNNLDKIKAEPVDIIKKKYPSFTFLFSEED